MAEQQPPTAVPAPHPPDPTLAPARDLTLANIDGFYRTRLPKSWHTTHFAWNCLEIAATDPDLDVDWRVIEQGFQTTLRQRETAPIPGDEGFMFAGMGLAYLGHFAAQRCQNRPPNAAENQFAFRVVGRLLNYALTDRQYDVTNNAVARLVTHGLFLRPGSPANLLPGSPREAIGFGGGKAHQAYEWEQAPRAKHPAKIVYSGRNRSGVHPEVTLLRVGHKIQETIAGSELPIRDTDPESRRMGMRHVARLVVDETKGYRPRPQDRQLLESVTATLHDKVQRDVANR